MALNLQKAKARRESGAFVPLPVSVLNHGNYLSLSPKAVKLLLDLCVQLRFKKGGTINNGDLSTAWKLMQPRGWVSKQTLQAALDELLHFKFLLRTRQGGRNLCSLYAVTWWAIDECDGKLDVGSTRAPSNEWQQEAASWKPRNGKKSLPRFLTPPAPISGAIGSPREVKQP
jgi:hypothetical protein